MREEEKKRTSQNSKLQQFFRKRWVFPAIYLVSAAVILTAVLWYQSVSNNISDNLAGDNPSKGTSYKGEEAVEVNAQAESFATPALDPDAVKVIKKFYDLDGSKEDQEAALVFYNNTYHPNKGIDLAKEDGKEFDVTASLSGTVVKAEKDPILGQVIELEHTNGVVTVYQSLAEAKVQAGDKVEQNEVIGTAGNNLFNEEGGVHVHFEIRKDGVALNPSQYLDKPVSSIKDQAAENEDTKASENADEDAAKEDSEASENADEDAAGEKDSPADENAEENSKQTDTETQKDANDEDAGSEDTNSQPEASTDSSNA
ncbi:M23 family metallopeptidase [Metabacillus arenae]|uniref:Peptidoglycan DD-metalloendopeptidase family protein n=1 Tax=Metabacillus arenae TaxID=2771434 RepID=A0A926RYQ9_9BACI|nr:M23 family metallopeptidase [Metabacillus arenae]MBD1383223.1 peptidoglycan DD-metalloendopeptidase family protein [Metabacillus arenae]